MKRYYIALVSVSFACVQAMESEELLDLSHDTNPIKIMKYDTQIGELNYDSKAVELKYESIFSHIDLAVRPKLHEYLANKGRYTIYKLDNSPLSEQEIKKEYGDDADLFFKKNTDLGNAFIHTIALDLKDLEVQAKNKAMLVLAALKTKANELDSIIEKKIHGAEVATSGCCKRKAPKVAPKTKKISARAIAQEMQKKASQLPINPQNNNNNPVDPKVAQILTQLQSNYNEIYQKLPNGKEASAVANAFKLYPSLLGSLTTQKRAVTIQGATQLAQTVTSDIQQGETVIDNIASSNATTSTTAVQELNSTVEAVGETLISSSPALQSAYAVYKMVMLVLNGLGFNSSAFEAAALQEEEVLLQDLAQDLESAKTKIESYLEAFQTKL